MKRFLAPGILLAALSLTIAGTVCLVSFFPGKTAAPKYDLKAERMRHLHQQIILFINGNQLQKAERQLKRILKIFPGELSSQKLLSKVFFLEGKLDEAESLLRTLAVLHPEDAVIRNNLGAVLTEKRFYESGIKELLEAWHLDPAARYILLNLCHASTLLGRLDLAEKYFQAAGKMQDLSSLPGEVILTWPRQSGKKE